MPPIIFTSFNESYAPFGAALLASLWANERGAFKVVILDTGIKTKTAQKLHQWAKDENRALDIITISPKLYAEQLGNAVKIPKDYPYYARLLAPYLCSENEKLLYVDADLICLAPFLQILDFPLQDCTVAASMDARYKTFDQLYYPPHPTAIIPNYHELGFQGNEPYFNSGVMLINAFKWRSEEISQRVLALSDQFPDHAILWDQYGLNIALHGKWQALEMQWNQTIDASIPATIFRHFADTKPIDYGCTHPDAKLFFHYLDQSPWKGWRPTKWHKLRKDWKGFKNVWSIRWKKLGKWFATPS